MQDDRPREAGHSRKPRTSATRAFAVTVAVLLASTSACSGGDSTAGTQATSSSTTSGVVTSTTSPSATTTPATTTPASTTASTTQPRGWTAPAICTGPCDPSIEVLFSLPIGDDGVSYEHVGMPDIEASGPSSLAVDEDGVIWVVDEVALRVLGFMATGDPVSVIDLTEHEAASASDIAVTPNGLSILDIFVATKRYRLLEIDSDGNLLGVHELPPGLHIEDGLTGIARGPQGEWWVELEEGVRVATLDVSGSAVSFEIGPGYSYPSGLYRWVEPFVYQAGDVEVNVTTTAPFGGLTFLGLNPDRSFVLQLDEVTVDDGGAFFVDQTVHLFDEAGNHLGAATFPLAEQFVEVNHPLTVGPDGYVYGLMTRPDRVDVVRLPYGS